MFRHLRVATLTSTGHRRCAAFMHASAQAPSAALQSALSGEPAWVLNRQTTTHWMASTKRKTPGSEPTGADGGRHAHAVGFRKEEKFVLSAMKASDCSQFCRGWLPGQCLRYSSNCRLNPWPAAGKSKFVIKNWRPIAIFLQFLHPEFLSYLQTGFVYRDPV